MRKLGLKIGKVLMSKYTYGAFEFFMHVMAIDMVAPKYGKHTLKEYFEELKNRRIQSPLIEELSQI